MSNNSTPHLAVSACLAGLPCRYDGCSKPDPDIVALVESGQALTICPEQLGGLPTPRIPAGLTEPGGAAVWQGQAQVINRQGKDVTDNFKAGALAALQIVQAAGIRKAVLKQHSPSCGIGSTGAAAGGRMSADGVTAALFKQQGIEVEPRG